MASAIDDSTVLGVRLAERTNPGPVLSAHASPGVDTMVPVGRLSDCPFVTASFPSGPREYKNGDPPPQRCVHFQEGSLRTDRGKELFPQELL